MTRAGDVDLRLAQQIRQYRARGLRVGLVHVASKRAGRRIAPEVQRCVRAAAAEIVNPAWSVETRLLIVQSPQLFLLLQGHLRRITAFQTLLVLDEPPAFDIPAKERAFNGLFGEITWAYTNRWVRDLLRARNPSAPVIDIEWRPIAETWSDGKTSEVKRRRIGWIVNPGRSELIDEVDLLPANDAFDTWYLGHPSVPLSDGNARADRFFQHGEIAIDRYLRKVDILAYFPPPGLRELPDAILTAAMAMGKPILLPQHLSVHYGDGPRYCDREQAPAKIMELLTEGGRGDALGVAVRDAVAASRSQSRHQEAIDRFLEKRSAQAEPKEGKVSRKRTATAKAPSSHRALFFSADGFGPDGGTSLLAVARRLDPRIEPVFVVTGAGADVAEAFGFVTETLAPQRPVWVDSRSRKAWLAAELESLIDAYRPNLAVFNGGGSDLVWPVAPREDCKLALVRACALAQTDTGTNDDSDLFDLIVGPADFDDAIPDERTAADEASAPIGPLLLLDDDELLSREDAAAALKIDASRPSLLIQLEGEASWKLVSVVEAALREMGDSGDLQVAIFAPWIRPGDAVPWAKMRVVGGYPIGQYLRAFDFRIGAANYETFHETIQYGIPTIFSPTRPSTADRQVVRARFAQEAGAALHFEQNKSVDLPQMLRVLLSADARAYLRENCRRLRRENGAASAAQALLTLVEG